MTNPLQEMYWTLVKIEISYSSRIEPTNQVVIPYIFKDIEEVKSFIKLAKEKWFYNLFLMSESIWKQLLVAKNEHVITFFSTDTVYSYFQDLFPTTHYDMIIGIPGAGKGAILVSFKLQGYRAFKRQYDRG